MKVKWSQQLAAAAAAKIREKQKWKCKKTEEKREIFLLFLSFPSPRFFNCIIIIIIIIVMLQAVLLIITRSLRHQPGETTSVIHSISFLFGNFFYLKKEEETLTVFTNIGTQWNIQFSLNWTHHLLQMTLTKGQPSSWSSTCRVLWSPWFTESGHWLVSVQQALPRWDWLPLIISN